MYCCQITVNSFSQPQEKWLFTSALEWPLIFYYNYFFSKLNCFLLPFVPLVDLTKRDSVVSKSQVLKLRFRQQQPRRTFQSCSETSEIIFTVVFSLKWQCLQAIGLTTPSLISSCPHKTTAEKCLSTTRFTNQLTGHILISVSSPHYSTYPRFHWHFFSHWKVGRTPKSLKKGMNDSLFSLTSKEMLSELNMNPSDVEPGVVFLHCAVQYG